MVHSVGSERRCPSKRALPLGWIVTPFLLSAVLLQAQGTKRAWRRVEAISGREAVLPCEVGPIDEADMIYVVLWYLNGRKEPIYSYDNRPRGLHAAEDRHVIQSDNLEGRVFFRPGGVPALHIKPVLRRDQANYTCRVDFRIANSKSTHLSLHVVIPPSQPVIEVKGQVIFDTILGPLQEGQPLRVSCVLTGGDPPPSVIWMKDGYVMDDVMESQTEEKIVNHLTIGRLGREYHESRLTCQATHQNRNTGRLLSFRSDHLATLFTSHAS